MKRLVCPRGLPVAAGRAGALAGRTAGTGDRAGGRVLRDREGVARLRPGLDDVAGAGQRGQLDLAGGRRGRGQGEARGRVRHDAAGRRPAVDVRVLVGEAGPICETALRALDLAEASLPLSRWPRKVGRAMAARMPMIRMTTRSSIRVKPDSSSRSLRSISILLDQGAVGEPAPLVPPVSAARLPRRGGPWLCVPPSRAVCPWRPK